MGDTAGIDLYLLTVFVRLLVALGGLDAFHEPLQGGDFVTQRGASVAGQP